MKITPVFFGDHLLLQVVVLVDTTNFYMSVNSNVFMFFMFNIFINYSV